MNTRGLGRSIMAAGVACILLYILLALRSPFAFNTGAANILFYTGVVALPLGVILFCTSAVKRRQQYRRDAQR